MCRKHLRPWPTLCYHLYRVEGQPRQKPAALAYKRRKRGAKPSSKQPSATHERERELELVLLAQKGDRAALDQLARGLSRCVEFTVRKVQGGDDEEKYQEGMMGMMRALQRFRSSFGVRFWTYAAWFVLNYAQRYVEKTKHLVHIPASAAARTIAIRVGPMVARYRAMTGEQPHVEDIAEILGVAATKVERALVLLSQTEVALVGGYLDAGGAVLEDELLVDPTTESLRDPETIFEETSEREGRAQEARRLLALLNPMERKVLSLRYLVDDKDRGRRTLEEVGRLCGGLSRERVRQIEGSALEKLRSLGARAAEAGPKSRDVVASSA